MFRKIPYINITVVDLLAIVASIVFFNNPIRPLFVVLLAIPFLGFLVNGIFRPQPRFCLKKAKIARAIKVAMQYFF